MRQAQETALLGCASTTMGLQLHAAVLCCTMDTWQQCSENSVCMSSTLGPLCETSTKESLVVRASTPVGLPLHAALLCGIMDTWHQSSEKPVCMPSAPVLLCELSRKQPCLGVQVHLWVLHHGITEFARTILKVRQELQQSQKPWSAELHNSLNLQ